ncbi:MAG: hypothetical protein N2C12_00235, partial [Planctomycetales bacterium]
YQLNIIGIIGEVRFHSQKSISQIQALVKVSNCLCCCSVKVTPGDCSGIMSPYERTGDINDEGTEEIARDQ